MDTHLIVASDIKCKCHNNRNTSLYH